MALTDLQVRAAKPKSAPYKLFDAGGLYLSVSPGGTRSWRVKYRQGGKERTLTLGPYPAVGLAEARRERDAAKTSLRSGRDPAFDRERRLERAQDDRFEVVARDWFKVKSMGWTERHAGDVIGSLERDIFPPLGAVRMPEIRPRDVLAALRVVEQRGAVETAHRLRQRIEDVFAFAMGMGMVEDNPAVVVSRALAPVRRGRQPAVVTIDEARATLLAAEAIPAHPTTKLALRLLALTVVRPGVVIEAPWSEFEGLDPAAPVWRVPAARMKLRLQHKDDDTRDHLVPLTPQAMEVLHVLRGLSGRSAYLFPSTRYYQKPMSENAIGYLLNRAGYHRRHVPHGWRATFSTVMNGRHRGDRDVIEKILAHTPDDKVAAAYNRALYLDRRRELLQEWADMLIVGQAEVSALLSMPRR